MPKYSISLLILSNVNLRTNTWLTSIQLTPSCTMLNIPVFLLYALFSFQNMEMEEKRKKVRESLDEDDLLLFRQLAIERWGLVDNAFRKRIWPKLYAINPHNIQIKPGRFLNELYFSFALKLDFLILPDFSRMSCFMGTRNAKPCITQLIAIEHMQRFVKKM